MTEYSDYVRSLKRLYSNKEIDIAKVKSLLSGRKISNDEYEFITKEVSKCTQF